MRTFLANLVAKTSRFASTKTKSGSGSTLPGLLAEKVDPNIIAKLSKKLPDGVILITGTNGKTTTAKMLAEIMTEAGHKVICNFSGSNLSRGIASLLTEHSSFFGTRLNAKVGIFEVDEATLPEITNKVSPKYILVTNLFRDQLDRYGELDKTAALIGSSLESSANSTIILNADDPLVASLTKYNKNVKYYGLDSKITTRSKGAIDSKDCLECGHELVYDVRYFGHLGQYYCPNCREQRPVPSYTLTDLDLSVESSSATYNTPRDCTKLSIQLPGLYNLYNALAAACLASELGIPDRSTVDALAKVSAAFGRMEKIQVGNKKLYLLLVKNPTGFTQVIETLGYDEKPKNILFALNDNFADGTDISWIWDAEIELIKNLYRHITVSGIRAEDLRLRLKYADIKNEQISVERDLGRALDIGLGNLADGETLYILPTYTAMLEIRKILKERGLVKGLME